MAQRIGDHSEQLTALSLVRNPLSDIGWTAPEFNAFCFSLCQKLHGLAVDQLYLCELEVLRSKGLVIAGNTCLVCVDHHRIRRDESDRVLGVGPAGADGLLVFVSLDLAERGPIRPFHHVPVLRGKGPADRGGEPPVIAATIILLDFIEHARYLV